MRKLLTFLFLLVSLIGIGQNFTPSDGGVQVKQSELTSETINVSGVIFQVYKGKYGKYIATVNRHNKLIPRFIGEKTSFQYQGKPVRVLNTSTFLYLSLNTLNKLQINYLE